MTAKDPRDPKGLIRESYRIDGITIEECRSIFLDWALSVPADNPVDIIKNLLTDHGAKAPHHPMTQTLTSALADAGPARRRGGRAGRLTR